MQILSCKSAVKPNNKYNPSDNELWIKSSIPGKIGISVKKLSIDEV